jgi:carboxymethylenebutenolidase
MTGGTGKRICAFLYSRDFVPSIAARYHAYSHLTHHGRGQLVDEMIFSFTHTQEMPWMLPGIPPTHRRVEVPLVAIVGFRDGKLAHEHIYWDQPSVFKQIGLLTDPWLPVCGAETACKVANPHFDSKFPGGA